MTVAQLILDLKIEIKEKRMIHLDSIGAPQMLIQREREYIQLYNEGKQKVQGQVKHKELMEAEVTAYYRQEFNASYYRGENDTTLMVMDTNKGTVYYDWYGNKISNKIEDLYYTKPNKVIRTFESFL